jgi:hypothetical protein
MSSGFKTRVLDKMSGVFSFEEDLEINEMEGTKRRSRRIQCGFIAVGVLAVLVPLILYGLNHR